MSKYEWERGTIKIPAKEWAGFRKGLIEAWNRRELARLERATALHGRLKEAVKGRRGSKRDEALRKALERLCPEREENEGVRDLLVSYDWKARKDELRGKPKKKDLRLLPLSKDARIDLPDALIVLQNKSRTVTWDVPENNHACEHARRHPIAQELFRRLGRIDWTRGSGGKIVGNDEYSSDCDYEGGGGNYVTAEYGPEAQKRRRAARAQGWGRGAGLLGRY